MPFESLTSPNSVTLFIEPSFVLGQRQDHLLADHPKVIEDGPDRGPVLGDVRTDAGRHPDTDLIRSAPNHLELVVLLEGIGPYLHGDPLDGTAPCLPENRLDETAPRCLLDGAAPYLSEDLLHGTAPCLPEDLLDKAAPYLPGYLLHGTAPYPPVVVLDQTE